MLKGTFCFSYYCSKGATEARPNDGENANECPLGFYCPVGTITPQPCPPGSYGTAKRLQSEEECQGCTPGALVKNFRNWFDFTCDKA